MTDFLSSPLRNLVGGLVFVLVVCVLATAGYVACGWPLDDAIYMVVMTVYTVGYGEPHPVTTPELRAITIALIVAGCTGMIFLTGVLVQLITASQLQQFLGVRRMQKDIQRLSGHVIICGFGRIGQMLARELREGRTECVVIERGEARIREARAHGFLALQGDATDEDTLKAAGVAQARALATVLPDDAANVFITLSARSLNRSMSLFARGEAPSTERKLLQAGADRVVLPAHIGAERIAELILFSDLGRTLEAGAREPDLARSLRRLGLELEVVPAAAGSRSAGLTVAALEAEAGGAFLVVALTGPDGGSVLQPPSEAVITAGNGVALVGRPGRAETVSRLFTAPE